MSGVNQVKLKAKISAITLMEVVVMFAIIAVIIMATLGISKARTEKIKAYQYYKAFTNLKHAVGEVFADGYINGTVLEKTLPPDGHNVSGKGLCDRLINTFNVIGTTDCNLTTSSDFDVAHTNFTLTNGMRFFNLGSNATANIFTCYIDINGIKGDGILDEDVMEFKIYRTGMVLPSITSLGGNDISYLSASVKDNNGAWLEKGITYNKAVCISGQMPYCIPPVSIHEHCVSAPCEIVINSP